VSHQSRVLITGGAGFIGSRLAHRCASAGLRVRVLDDLSSGTLDRLEAVQDRIDFVHGCITSQPTIEQAVSDCDCVFHLAARPSVPESVRDPLRTHAVNATGTLQVLRAAQLAGVRRFVLASSCAIYGESLEPIQHEGARPSPHSAYAIQKLTSEEYCREFSRQHGLETCVLRFFNVYGPGQDPHSSYAAVVPRFLSRARSGLAPEVHGSGLQSRDFVFVEDVVAALESAASASEACAGEPINIGSGRSHRVLELAEMICELCGLAPELEYAPARSGDVAHSRASRQRAMDCLGWAPKTDLREGLSLTLASS